MGYIFWLLSLNSSNEPKYMILKQENHPQGIMKWSLHNWLIVKLSVKQQIN